MLWKAFLEVFKNPPSVAGHHFSSSLSTTCGIDQLSRGTLALEPMASRKVVCERGSSTGLRSVCLKGSCGLGASEQ